MKRLRLRQRGVGKEIVIVLQLCRPQNSLCPVSLPGQFCTPLGCWGEGRRRGRTRDGRGGWSEEGGVLKAEEGDMKKGKRMEHRGAEGNRMGDG